MNNDKRGSSRDLARANKRIIAESVRRDKPA
jgi:hypothetical protein